VLLVAGVGGALAMRRRRAVHLNDPVVAAEPLAVEPTLAAETPAPVASSPVPIAPLSTAPAAAPRMAGAPIDQKDEDRILQEMVAAPPSPENPFLTQAKRMRRARFLLEQRKTPPSAASAPFAVTASAPQRPAPSQTVYSFGKEKSRPGGFLKPRTQ
jgi:hypothetical protein